MILKLLSIIFIILIVLNICKSNKKYIENMSSDQNNIQQKINQANVNLLKLQNAILLNTGNIKKLTDSCQKCKSS